MLIVQSTSKGDIKLTYKYKSRYLTRLYHFYGEADGSEEEEGERTFNVETKKGYPVKITENFDSSSEVFKVNFYKKGAKKGLIKDATRISNSEGYLTKDVYKCTYTIKKGLITKAVVKRSRTIDTDTYDDKYVFTLKYTKTKADKKRYTSMINDVIGNLSTSTYYSEQLVYTYWY